VVNDDVDGVCILLQELFAANRQYVNTMSENHDDWIQQQNCQPLTADACSQMSSSRMVNILHSV